MQRNLDLRARESVTPRSLTLYDEFNDPSRHSSQTLKIVCSRTTRFTVQIDNSSDQQASFTNFSCKIESNESAADLCEQMKEKYFATLIRKF